MERFDLVKSILSYIINVKELRDGDCFEYPSIIMDKHIIKYDEESLKRLLSTEISLKGLEMYSEKLYEYPVDSRSFRKIDRDSKEIEIDGTYSTRRVNLEISTMSSTYFVNSLIAYIQSMTEGEEDVVIRGIIRKTDRFFRLRRRKFKSTNDDLQEGNYIDLIDFLVEYLHLSTFKVTSDSNFDLAEFKKLRSSFIFEYLYNTGIKVEDYFSLSDYYRFRDRERAIERDRGYDKIPAREYDENLVEFYTKANNTEDSYIKFISYYHIIEFYYDKVFKEKLIKEVQDIITKPDFSYTNEESINKIVNKVKSKVKINRNDGQGNELESLKIVLNKFTTIDEIKDKLNEQNSTFIQYYANNKVSFSKAKEIKWNDESGVYSTIANRIYDNRNSLIHSKESEKYKRYSHFKNEAELIKEIPLIKAIAELIIINSAQIIK